MELFINKNRAIQYLLNIADERQGENDRYADGWHDCIEYLSDIDSVCVEPVRHGKWVLHGNDDDLGSSYWCSECGYNEDEDLLGDREIPDVWKRCPNCGARMDKE